MAGGGEAPAGRVGAGRFSPEPRIRRDSTTGAGGSSGALIGPSARRRRGLWGNRGRGCGPLGGIGAGRGQLEGASAVLAGPAGLQRLELAALGFSGFRLGRGHQVREQTRGAALTCRFIARVGAEASL